MAHARKGQTVKVPSYCGWWRHLRRYGKRAFWKSQRKADKQSAREAT